MRIFDLSRKLYEGMPSYPGDPEFSISKHSALVPEDPDSCALSVMSLSTHTGTHVDAPAHFIAGGSTAEELPLDVLCGRTRVLDVSGPVVNVEILSAFDLRGVERLILKTSDENGCLAISGAEHLRKKTRVRLVGIDSLSIEAHNSRGRRVHKSLLGASPPILIVEGLDLSVVSAGDYDMFCLPLRIRSADGAPARVILVRQ